MRFIFLASLLVLGSSAQAQSFCSGYSEPVAFKAAKDNAEKKIETFANSKLIATQADATLSKLIAAKSPVIGSWFSKRDLANKTEDEIVKAWRLYYAQNFVLSKYPQADSKVNAEMEQLVDGILKENLKSDFVARTEKLFEKAKTESIAALDSMKIENKEELLKRVKAIKLYWPKKLKDARNNAVPLDLIDWGIAYDPVPNEINIGLDALSYPNDETYLAVFAHEIGHSFDPCRWGAFFTGAWPFTKVGECLRSGKSVAAKNRDDSQLEPMVKAGQVSADIAAGLKLNPTCNKLVYPPSDVQADQLSESFADWFSAEVVARVPGIDVMNIRTDLCNDKKLSDGSSYVSNLDRLNKIYFAQPKLKEKRAEKSDAAYCAL